MSPVSAVFADTPRGAAAVFGPQPSPLVAVRTSAAAWNSLYNLRSPALTTWMDERDAASAALRGAKASLMDALFAAVPRARSTEARRALLRAKRAVFREEPPDAIDLGDAADVQSHVERYRVALD